MNLTRIFTLAICVAAPHATAETVAIDYVLDSATASIDPFTIPNPQGGADITIAPSITLNSGSFDAQFFNADGAGTISDGDASIIGVEFSGSIEIALSTTIDVFGFPVTATATISGPIAAEQQSDSDGNLTGLTLYAETVVGQYDVAAGPLDCSDSAFGIFCSAIETILGSEFPIAEIGGETALPFAGGTFTDLNPLGSSLGSSAAAQIDFSFPLTDELNFGVKVDSTWIETERLVLVPEPTVPALMMATIGLSLLRRNRLR